MVTQDLMKTPSFANGVPTLTMGKHVFGKVPLMEFFHAGLALPYHFPRIYMAKNGHPAILKQTQNGYWVKTMVL